MARPKRRFGDVLRVSLCCPLCAVEPMTAGGPVLRVVAYRDRTVRLECRACNLRFSVDAEQAWDAIMATGFKGAYATVTFTRHERD